MTLELKRKEFDEFINEIPTLLKNLEEKIKKLDNEYKNLESLEQNEIKAKKSEFTKKVNSIKSFYFEALKKIADEIINLEIIIAENTEVKIPTINVVANEAISPVPKAFKIIATNK